MINLTRDGARLSNNIVTRVRYNIRVDRNGKIVNKKRYIKKVLQSKIVGKLWK